MTPGRRTRWRVHLALADPGGRQGGLRQSAQGSARESADPCSSQPPWVAGDLPSDASAPGKSRAPDLKGSGGPPSRVAGGAGQKDPVAHSPRTSCAGVKARQTASGCPAARRGSPICVARAEVGEAFDLQGERSPLDLPAKASVTADARPFSSFLEEEKDMVGQGGSFSVRDCWTEQSAAVWR